MDHTTSEQIGNLVESLQCERDFAQERIDAIGIYQRSLVAYRESTPSCPEIHHRVWTLFGDLEGKMRQAFEVRNYTLATKAELLKLPYHERFEINGEAWEISFSCGSITDEKGTTHPILCRKEDYYEDKYRLFRGVGLHNIDGLTSYSSPWRVEHQVDETCDYYQKLGVKEEVIQQLRPQLEELNNIPYEKLLGDFRSEIEERLRVFDKLIEES